MLKYLEYYLAFVIVGYLKKKSLKKRLKKNVSCLYLSSDPYPKRLRFHAVAETECIGRAEDSRQQIRFSTPRHTGNRQYGNWFSDLR